MAFYIQTPKEKLDFIKIQIFCCEKDTVKRMKRQVTDCRKYLEKTFDKGLLSKIHKELLNSTVRKPMTQFKNWPKFLIDTTEDTYMANI